MIYYHCQIIFTRIEVKVSVVNIGAVLYVNRFSTGLQNAVPVYLCLKIPGPSIFFPQSINQRAGVALDFHMGESSAPSVQSFNCSVAVAMIQSVFLSDYEESVNKQNVADCYSFLN